MASCFQGFIPSQKPLNKNLISGFSYCNLHSPNQPIFIMKATIIFICSVFYLFMAVQCEKDTKCQEIIQFPDSNFYYALIDWNIVDTNDDGEIDICEARDVKKLYLNMCEISDLSGIEYFVNLDTLYCSLNNISELDLSDLKNLIYVDAALNPLSFLNVSDNYQLSYLDASFTSLEDLFLSNNTKLECINFSFTNITSINTSNITDLQEFYCSSSELRTLNIFQNTKLTILDISEIPSLSKVCVWIMPFPPQGVQLDFTGSPSVYFTTECLK